MLESLHFRITPREDLKRAIQGDSLLAEHLGLVLECEIERRGRSEWTLNDYTAQAKVAVIVGVCELRDSDSKLFRQLFDFPELSAIEVFDRWWTISTPRYDEFILGELSDADPSTLS